MSSINSCKFQTLCETPLVSVIIPTFNRKVWLRTAIESLLRQTYRNIQIVVVDDGSTDGTADELRDLLSRSEVKYIYQKNSGRPACARNVGLGEADGELVAFLDSDDLLVPVSVSRRIEVFRSFPSVGFVCTDWLCFSGSLNDGTKPSVIAAYNFIDRLPQELLEHRVNGVVVFGKNFVFELFNSDFVNTSSVMIRREVIEEVGGFNEAFTIGEDCDLWLRIGMLTRMAFVEEPLSYLRNHCTHLTCDERKNYEQDTKVISAFMKRVGPIPTIWRKRLNRRLASFYEAGGMVFLRAADRRSALKFFIKALSCYPTSWRTIKNVMRCLL